MPSSLLEHIKSLNKLGMSGDVKSLCSYALSLSDSNPQFLSAQDRLDVLLHYAHAFYKEQDIKTALHFFQKALLLKKSALKPKGKAPGTQDDAVAADIKYQIYRCHLDLRLFGEAQVILENVTAKMRTPAIHLGLARIYERKGQDRAAITAYREVLKECPMSLEAAKALLRLGVKTIEVTSLLATPPGCADWLPLWLRANTIPASTDYSESISAFSKLLTKPLVPDCPDILTSAAYIHVLNGDPLTAIEMLQKVHSLRPHQLKGMDLLSHLLYLVGQRKELEVLVPEFYGVTNHRSEPWVALAYLALASGRGRKALNFTQKALDLNPENVEAHIVRGEAFVSQAQSSNALTSFREATRLSPHRFEAHKGIVDCYINSQRLREAMNYATHVCNKTLGKNCRTITLCGTTLARDPAQLDKAKSYLEKAIRCDPSNLTPVYALTEILGRQQAFVKGLSVLRGALRVHSSSQLHQMMAEFLMASNGSLQEALEHYSRALHIDPHNHKAREGRERAEKSVYQITDGGPSFEIGDSRVSDPEVELEDSDADSTWSDLDMA